MQKVRMRRIYNNATQKMIIVPLDHGVSMGPIQGIENIRNTIKRLINTNCNAIVLHKGNIVACKDIICSNDTCAVVMHLSASVGFSPNANLKILIGSVEEAVRLGADGVSIHVNIGDEADNKMLKDFGMVAKECEMLGMPLLAMVYPRGKNLMEKDHELNMICARVAMELGADIVKINYVGEKEKFKQIVNSVNIPVVIAGGVLDKNRNLFFDKVKDAIEVGGGGVAIGRNIFQQENMESIINDIYSIINNVQGLKNVA